MKQQVIHTQFQSDQFTLDGTLHLPLTPNPPLVIGSHGLEGTKESAKQTVLSKILPDNGIAFFRFDHRGCGKSQGNFIEDTSLATRTQDFFDAVRHVLSLQKTSSQIALFGSSMGGATCINVWENIKKLPVSLKGAVLCAAPLISSSIQNIPTQANENRGELPISFFAQNLLFDLSQKAAGLSNILIFHGDADSIVPVTNAQMIFDLAGPKKELVLHKNGDHQMNSRKDQKDFEERAIRWFSMLFNLSDPAAA